MSRADVIHTFADRPFEYGFADCCQFVRELVRADTGEDQMADWPYLGQFDAEALIARYGSLRACVTSQLGPAVSVSDSEDGDVLLVDHGGREWLAYNFMGRCIYKTRNSITAKPLDFAVAAWRVPRG